MVLAGFKHGRAYINDHAHGRQRMSMEDFERSYSGICLTFEPGESFVDAVKREMKEETGLDILNPRLVGIKQFPIEKGRYIVLLFKATEFTGTVVSSDEGEMEWIDIDRLADVNVVEDFHDLMKIMNDPNMNEFQYTIEGEDWIVHLK